MIKTYFQMRFTNDFHYQKEKLNSVLEYLKNEIPNLTQDDLFDLRIIYNELIANAFIHGHKKDFTKKVDLLIKIADNDITSIIRDEGTGFDYSSLLESDKISDNTFCEHGRGLQLVLGLADYVEWNDTGNEIMFHKNYQTK